MHKVFVGNQDNLVMVQNLKKLLYSGNFNHWKDFWHEQNAKAYLFNCISELWVLNDFFFKKDCFRITFMVLSNTIVPFAS